jgi:hypothetical protein
VAAFRPRVSPTVTRKLSGVFVRFRAASAIEATPTSVGWNRLAPFATTHYGTSEDGVVMYERRWVNPPESKVS